MGMGEVPIGNLDTTTALIYDSVTAFAIALNKLDTVQQVNDMFKLKLIVIINQIEQFFLCNPIILSRFLKKKPILSRFLKEPNHIEQVF